MTGIRDGSVKTSGLSNVEVDAFRSEPQKVMVTTGIFSKSAPSGMGEDGPKVSEFGLESYLNACAPTCHG